MFEKLTIGCFFLFLLLLISIQVFADDDLSPPATRLRISFTNSLPNSGSIDDSSRWQGGTYNSFLSSAIHQGATVRLYDPVTDLTYHQSNDPRLVEVLSKMWNPRYHAVKCGASYRNQFLVSSSTTPVNNTTGFKRKKAIQRRQSYLCDPGRILRPSQAFQLDKTILSIPMTTGCQCNSCNKYNSGFTVYVAVIPIVLETTPKPTRKGQQQRSMNKINHSNSSDNLSTRKLSVPVVQKTIPFGEALLRNNNNGNRWASSSSDAYIYPSNLVVSDDMRGIQRNIIQPGADIYELLALYLRAFWATGECDEDMVICFFPKEKKLSLSVGGRLLAKLTPTCLSNLVADTSAKLAEISLDTSNRNYTSKIDTVQLTDIFQSFIAILNLLIQSRQSNPCATVADNQRQAKWSNIDIFVFASIISVCLAITAVVTLRTCTIACRWASRRSQTSNHQRQPSLAESLLLQPEMQMPVLGESSQNLEIQANKNAQESEGTTTNTCNTITKNEAFEDSLMAMKASLIYMDAVENFNIVNEENIYEVVKSNEASASPPEHRNEDDRMTTDSIQQESEEIASLDDYTTKVDRIVTAQQVRPSLRPTEV